MEIARTRTLSILTVALIIATSFSSLGFACLVCKRSPTGWGFCRAGFDRGHSDCKTVEVDRFTGRTDCEIVNWGDCYNGGTRTGDGDCIEAWCEPFDQYAMRPCAWTDTDSVRLV